MNTGRPGDDEARVVVVDDETHVADLYAEYLRTEYEVAVAYGGEEALEVIDDDVDVVLLDRRMPRVTGGEVLDDLRERGIDCRVVMVTAVEPDFDTVEMEFDDYITKPVDRDVVVDMVREQRLLDQYDARLDEFVRKKKKVRLLEERRSRAELKESDRYKALRVVVDSLREDLQGLLDEYDLDPERRPDALDDLDWDDEDDDDGEDSPEAESDDEDEGDDEDDGDDATRGDDGVDWEPIGGE